MANDSEHMRRRLRARGYQVERMTGRAGRSAYEVTDRRTGRVIARFPVHARPGKWDANLLAGIRRYERTGVAPRSNRRSAGRVPTSG